MGDPIRTAVTAVLVLLAVVPAAKAQLDCLDFSPPLLFDTSGNPTADPGNPRSRGAEVFSWSGHQYLVHGIGNELEMFRVDDPEFPGPAVDSNFNVPPLGDRDYNLFNFTVCDDCRYGAAGYDVQGLVLFDLGTGTSPHFEASRRYTEAGTIGAFTFSYNSQQYLVARVSPECQGNALVTFDGVEPSELGLVQCLTDLSGNALTVDAGFWLDDLTPGDDVVGFVYLLESSMRNVHMFAVRVQGGQPRLHPAGAVIHAVWILDHGLDVVDRPPAPWAPFAVSAYNDGLSVWDLSDPLAPERVSNRPLPYMVAANAVELEYPYLYVGTMHTVDDGSSHTYDISNPFDPVEFEPEFWEPQQPWNALGYMTNKGGAFTPGGEWLFLSRYSVLERFHVDCVEIAPLAAYGLSPDTAFPGDLVTLTNATPPSQYTLSALWVEDAAGTIVAGSGAMAGSTPTTLELQVPADLALAESYSVHVAVANATYPCDDPVNQPDLCGSQVASGELPLDRTPETVVRLTPPLVLTDQALTLDGLGSEGHPSAYLWEVLLDGSEPPSGAPAGFDPSAPLTQYELDLSGEWTFRLTADYLHEAPGGGAYSSTAMEVRQVSSVAADFSVYPAPPVSTEDVVLCSDSLLSPDLRPDRVEYDWKLCEDSECRLVVASLSSCVPGLAECGGRCGVRLDESYFPDQMHTWWVQLTVTNVDFIHGGAGDTSVHTEAVTVTNGWDNLDFAWVPADPLIGDTVLFALQSSAPPDTVTWDFGGVGCPGYSQGTTCTAGPFLSCLTDVYRYATPGPRSVTVWVSVGGQTYGPVSRTLEVQSAGSCDPGGVDFTVSDVTPDIGETVTFVASDGCATPQRWEMGGASCDGETGVDCAASPDLCRTVTWQYASPGIKALELTCAEGTSPPRSLAVQAVGTCPDCEPDAPPVASFTVAPSPARVGQPVTFADTSEQGSGDDLPTSWAWEVTLDGQPVVGSEEPVFTHAFAAAGEYTVTLTASNCRGSDSAAATLAVWEELIVPAVVHAPGLNGTLWRSDLRLYNPGAEEVAARVEVRPRQEPQSVFGVDLQLGAHATLVLDDAAAVLGDLQHGTARVRFPGATGAATPVVVSRTTNEADEGTFGQYIPAVPALEAAGSVTLLPGLVHDDAYRTNLLLANLGGGAVADVVIRVLDADGAVAGSATAGIPAYGSNLLVGIAELAGVTGPLDLFTLEVDAGGAAVHASASLVDNRTGDPVLVVEGPVGQPELVIPGVAHLPGALGSRWRTDVTLLNPGDEPLTCRLDYLPETTLPDDHGLDLSLEARQAVMLEDVLGSLVGADAVTKGFLRVRGTGGSAAPRVMARTYNLAADGTFGQRLEVYGPDELIGAGETRAIAGVATGDPADDGVGFRINLGLTNASATAAARLLVTLYAGPQGQVVGQIPYTLQADQFVQFDPFAAVGLGGDFSAYGSVEVRVDEGGPVAAYASVVDNATQDPILIPALSVE